MLTRPPANCTLYIPTFTTTAIATAKGNPKYASTTEEIAGSAIRENDRSNYPRLAELYGVEPTEELFRIWIFSDRPINWQDFKSITFEVNLGVPRRGILRPFALGHPMVDACELNLVMGAFKGVAA